MQRWSPVGREVLEAGVLLRPEVLHGSLEGGVVAGHDVLLSLQGMLPLFPLPACAAYLGPPLTQRLLHSIQYLDTVWDMEPGVTHQTSGLKAQTHMERDKATSQNPLNPGNNVCNAGHIAAVPCPA